MYRYCCLAVLFLLGSLSACSNWTGDGNAVSDKVDRKTITIWAPMQSTEGDKLMRKQVKAFNGSQRNIEVQLTLVQPDDYPAMLITAREEGRLPAILCLDSARLKAFADDSLLEPLDKMMSQRLWRDVLPELLEHGHVDTHIYGVPAVHQPNHDLLWSVLREAEDKAATMAFIHYLLHPDQQRAAVGAGYTQPVTYSAMKQ